MFLNVDYSLKEYKVKTNLTMPISLTLEDCDLFFSLWKEPQFLLLLDLKVLSITLPNSENTLKKRNTTILFFGRQLALLEYTRLSEAKYLL
jgi:hypothetical protein